MRFVVASLIVLQVASMDARADERTSLRAANRLRMGGVAVLVTGVIATILGQVLVAEGVSWELGNGLGEHYDPTPSWVPRFETAGYSVLAAGQVGILSGIAMLGVGDTKRDQALANVVVRF